MNSIDFLFYKICGARGPVFFGIWKVFLSLTSQFLHPDSFSSLTLKKKTGDNDWVQDIDSDGIYISKDQIKFIEFKKGGSNYDTKQENNN